MDPHLDLPEESEESPAPKKETIECGMCRRRVPVDQTRILSGRALCFGCLASWYDQDED